MRGLEDRIIAMGRAFASLPDDVRAIHRLTLENPHSIDPSTGAPIDPVARELALTLLRWEPEPLAGDWR
ncbi:MAG: hypothetical protein ABR992_20540 [Solirubrobacteraceae bacterium]|jgi:hypothetical protein